jgi:alpha-beta hydrolase superfamily lysophospholipase
MRGHGRSEGEPLYVEKFSDYTEDLAKLVRLAKERESGLPTFVLGHSAGGVVACVYTLDHQSEIAGFICESFAHEGPLPTLPSPSSRESAKSLRMRTCSS